MHFLEITHLDLGFCFDTGHAHVMEGVEQAFDADEGSHPLDAHPRQRRRERRSLFPFSAQGGTIDWRLTMGLLRSRPAQYPLLLELREYEGLTNPVRAAREVFDKLENLSTESD